VCESKNKDVRLEVGLVRDAEGSTEGSLHIRVSAIKEAAKTPVNVLCLVDTSGSMDDDVVIQNADGVRENTGMNLLDLARHAVATVAHGLDDKDMLGIIGWSHVPDKEMELTPMDAAGKKKADDLLDVLTPHGSTGMNEVIDKAFKLVKKSGKPTIIFLLTDGRPDKVPKNGYGAYVRNFMEKTKVPVQLNTFGFGYGVDSELLTTIAEAGRGTFSFIPDGGLLGTVIVNSIANTVSVGLTDAQVSVDLCDGISFAENALKYPKGSLDMPICNSDGSVVFNIGSVNFQQPRSVVLPVKIAAGFAAGAPVASVSVTCSASGKSVNVALEDAVSQVLPTMRFPYSVAAAARAKTMFADTLFQLIHLKCSSDEYMAKAAAELKACADEMKKLLEKVGTNAQITDILRDCEGQASEAVSKLDWLNRWGLHYLRSLCGAHEFEICNNFKDPGVQHYGGPLFASIRDDLDDIFQSLPPPKHNGYYSDFGRSGYTSARVSMSSFMDRYSGCFAGSCTVVMADGTSKKVSEVRKGDVLRTGCKSEATATVIATVQTAAGGEVCAFTPSELLITPWHPIDLESNDKWSFPADSKLASRRNITEPLFTFVLDRAHSVLVNGIRCVTLAHGITSGSDARAHPYFGSNACIEDLKKFFAEDYAAGHVTLPAKCVFSRDATTNLVNGISL